MAALALIFAVHSLSAGVIYVSSTGSDTRMGDTIARAVKTLNRAQEVAAPGDEVRLISGHISGAATLTKRLRLVAWNGTATAGRGIPEVEAGPPQRQFICSGAVGVPLGTASSVTASAPAIAAGYNPVSGGAKVATPGYGQVALAGQVTDPDGGFVATWSVLSGPGEFQFSNPTNLHTWASFNGVGQYHLRLTVVDGPYVVTDDVEINTEEVVCESRCRDFTVSTDSSVNGQVGSYIDLVVSAAKANHQLAESEVAAEWKKISGPGTVIFDSSGKTMTTKAWFSQKTAPGEHYKLQLAVTHIASRCTKLTNVWLEITNELACTVALSVPTSLEVTTNRFPAQLTLNGVATPNPSGSPVVHQWSQLSGPGSVQFGDRRVPRQAAIFTNYGTYLLLYCATNLSCSPPAYDCKEVTVVVKREEPSCPPIAISLGGTRTNWLDDTANVGIAVTPSICTNIVGRVNSTAATTIRWTLDSGPSDGVDLTRASSTNVTVCFTKVGTYVLRMTATAQNNPDCQTSVTVTNAVRYAARHYITKGIYSDLSCVCGHGIEIVNTHRTCPIRFRRSVTSCPSAPAIPTAEVALERFGSPDGRDRIRICGANAVAIENAQFLCPDDPMQAAAWLQLPAAGDLPQATIAQVQASGAIRAASADVGLNHRPLEFLLFGEPGQDYVVEASVNLTNWMPIAVVTASDNPVWIQDPDGGGHQRRFYRAVLR